MALLTAGKRNWCLTQKSQSGRITDSDVDSSQSIPSRRSVRRTRRWIIRRSWGSRWRSKGERNKSKNARIWNMTCVWRLSSTKRSKSRHRRRQRNHHHAMIKTFPRPYRSHMCSELNSLASNHFGGKNQSSNSTSDPILRRIIPLQIPIYRGRLLSLRCRRNNTSTIPTLKRSDQWERLYRKKWTKFIEKYSNQGIYRSIRSYSLYVRRSIVPMWDMNHKIPKSSSFNMSSLTSIRFLRRMYTNKIP